MKKVTVFFSHSSLDKEAILTIKKKLEKTTSGTIDIFMSSDGQSIPFGRNWVHRVEEGLQDATIMFVFMTENSIRSGWIFFEAGYSYSRNIRVIPIGLGISIDKVNAPLNLLQGFNINSGDSLNNILTILNQELKTSFEDCFTEADYSDLMELLTTGKGLDSHIESLIDYADCEIRVEYRLADGGEELHNTEYLFNRIIDYLKGKDIQFSLESRNQSTTIVTNGIRILLRKGWSGSESPQLKSVSRNDSISFHISSLNFQSSLELFFQLISLSEDIKRHYIKLHFQNDISCYHKEEDVSSVLALYPEEFEADKERIGLYKSSILGVGFLVFDDKKIEREQKPGILPEYVISVLFNKNEIDANRIILLVRRLYEIGFIHHID